MVPSLRFDGVRFYVYLDDHEPRHVHGRMGGAEVIVDLRSQGGVAVARRAEDAVWGRTKRSEVKKILKIADRHFEELVGLWEEIHGSADKRRRD